MATEIHINEIKPDNSVFVSTSVNNIEIATTSAPAGPKGDKGDKGDQGNVGPKGDQGDQGLQGDKGDQGDQGLQGDIGPQGEKGDTGDQGLQGEKGDTGDQGPQGEKGDTGDQGLQGDKGDQGDLGPKGDQGEKGDKGDTGDQGDVGPQGDKGDQGDQGDIGYPAFLYDTRRVYANQYTIGEIVSYNGNYYICIASNDALPPGPGAELYWAPYSFVGPQGEKGDTGDQGPQGDKGDTGDQGIQGEKGDKGDTGDQGIPGSGVAGNHDLGVIYLKNNTTATTIPSLNARAVVAGTMQTGTLFNFEKDATTNSLKYTGDGGRFHVVATFNFYSGSNNTCGFYIGKNTNPASALDPNADRISESEIYANAVNQNKPSATAIQTVLDLNPGDRIFFIVQNKDSTASITVEFLKFVAVTLTAEKGDIGPEGPPVDTSTLVPYSGATGNVDLGVNDLDAGDIYSNGNRVATVVDPVRTTLTGNGTLSTFAISGADNLVNPSALIVAIDGILQEPSVDYTVASGNITFTSPLPSGSKAVVISPINTLQVSNMIPADGSVTSAKIVGGVSLSEPIIANPAITGGTVISNLSGSSGYAYLNLTGIQRSILREDFTTTATFVNVFTLPVVAGKQYFVRAWMRIRGTAGSIHAGQIGGTFNIGDADIVGMYRRPGFESTNIVLATTPFQGFSFFTSTGTANQMALIEAVFTPLTSGDLRFGCGATTGSTAGSSVTLYKGSFLELTEL
jgi:hypothetical protein